jgi:hypothetical protein
VPIVEYTPDLWNLLQDAVSRLQGMINLSHRPFVDYYYATKASCKLFLWRADDGRVLGTLGREVMPFVYQARPISIRVGSNWYSLQRGVGKELVQFSGRLNLASVGLMFTGSEDSVNILQHYDYVFVAGIKAYSMNSDMLAQPGEPKWKSQARKVRRLVRRPVSKLASHLSPEETSGVTVREEHAYTEDLLPRSSPFIFRFAPSAEYLAWRYNLSLSFVRYRLFRVVCRGASIGYVILNESPERLVVAQCDGEDPGALAHGVLLSLAELERESSAIRAVYLTCSDPQMQTVFERAGLKGRGGADLPFAFRRDQWPFETSLDASSWLVNYDWGDNGLRSPFLDE